MKRTVAIEIDGKRYPLRKTLLCFEELSNATSGGSDLSALLTTIAILMKNGAAYETMKGNTAEWSRDEDGNIEILTREELGLLTDDDDVVYLRRKMDEAFAAGDAEEISATETTEAKKAKKKEPKNTPEATR